MKATIIVLFTFLLIYGCGEPQKSNETEQESTSTEATAALYMLPQHDSLFIDSVLKAYPFFKDQERRVKAFYNRREYRPAWFTDHGISEQAGEVVNLINDYLSSGIVDSAVFMQGIGALYDSVAAPDFVISDNEGAVLSADVLFTGQFFAFSDRAWKGAYVNKLKDLDWFLPAKKFSQVSYLDSLLKLDPKKIAGSEPVFRQYHALRKKLQELVAIEKAGGWDSIMEPAKALTPGDTATMVVLLRKRLALQMPEGRAAMAYDSIVVRAVKVFQECHGLNATGLVDKKVVREMNVSVGDRIKSVLINLERWKWVPPDPGSEYIAVNIPEFTLHVYEKGKLAWDMAVIVGKNANQTTIFSGDMKYVVFAPYWNIPRSIAVKEILPALKRDKNYLESHQMEAMDGEKVVKASKVDWNSYTARSLPYSFRQKPGEHNSLGLVKFLFPNSYSIYLHDTPGKWLFEKEGRDFSHGCIRLSEPHKLAAYLLRDESKWDSTSISKAMHNKKEEYVTLKKPMTVYITYFTSWVDSRGRLNFRDDIYGHDGRLGKMMFK